MRVEAIAGEPRLAGNGRGPWQEPQRGRRPCPARPAGNAATVASLANIPDMGRGTRPARKSRQSAPTGEISGLIATFSAGSDVFVEQDTI